jgi:4-hydroxybenzoate polyprenyltransferase
MCVDLDGTLIATDVLYESILLLMRHRPWDLFKIPFWLLKSRAHLKSELAARVRPDPSVLPYRTELLDFLREQKTAGRVLYLVTASEQHIADAVTDHLGIFDGAIGSDSSTNLKGAVKASRLVERFGTGGFDYIGDSLSDLPVWEMSRKLYVVAGGERVLEAARTIQEPARVFPTPGGVVWQILRAMRPHQWIKNILVFLPLILAHHAGQFDKLLLAFLAYVTFSLSASAIYILNDLMDVEADRRHRSKKNRPFASGRLPLAYGPALLAVLLIVAFAISLSSLPLKFALMLLGYVLISCAYSLHLKRRLLIDVFCLSSLYTWRILAGGVAVSVPVTPWLLALSIFLFTSLAFAKRCTELQLLRAGDKTFAEGRSYYTDDIEVIYSVGPASGYLSVLVLSLYINSEQVTRLYAHPFMLWLVCPILLYWITRLWFFVRRGALHDDPILFAIRDRVSWACGVMAVLLVVLATV